MSEHEPKLRIDLPTAEARRIARKYENRTGRSLRLGG